RAAAGPRPPAVILIGHVTVTAGHALGEQQRVEVEQRRGEGKLALECAGFKVEGLGRFACRCGRRLLFETGELPAPGSGVFEIRYWLPPPPAPPPRGGERGGGGAWFSGAVCVFPALLLLSLHRPRTPCPFPILST